MHGKLFFIIGLLIGVCTAENLKDLVSSVFTPTESGPLKNRLVTLFSTTMKPAPFTTSQFEESDIECGSGKECVQEYLCTQGNTNTDSAKSIDIRIDIDNPDKCPFLQTCCFRENIVTEPIIRKTKIQTGCGYRNKNGVGFKIVGATTEAEFGEFPWMLAILTRRNDFDKEHNMYQCGGSLIHPQVAVTSAHCVYDKPVAAFKVRAGEWETNSKAEPYPNQDRYVKDIVVHENFNAKNLHNDIALLFLQSPFELAPHVNTLCLPPAGYNFDFTRCFASGWGKDQFQNGKYQNILKKIELPILPSYLCQDQLRETYLGKYFILDSSFICAGGELGQDTCKGDGGSPLVCPIDSTEDRYYLAGIVAWGIGCGKINVPGVYANVAHFRTWIDKKLLWIDSSYFTV